MVFGDKVETMLQPIARGQKMHSVHNPNPIQKSVIKICLPNRKPNFPHPQNSIPKYNQLVQPQKCVA